jgi:hypothetical protein
MMPVVPTSYLPPSPALSSFHSESLTSQLDGLPLPPIVPSGTVSKGTTVIGRDKKVKIVKAATKKLKLKFRLATKNTTNPDSHFTPDSDLQDVEACRAKLQASCGSFFRTMAGCDGQDPL